MKETKAEADEKQNIIDAMGGSNIYGLENEKDILELIGEHVMCVVVILCNSGCGNDICFEKVNTKSDNFYDIDYNVIQKEQFL